MTEEKSIIALNRDVEPFVLQANYTRSEATFRPVYGDKYTPLCFVHAADMHNVPAVWNRMIQYVNYYHDHIDFALHTGDYCGGCQLNYTDMYAASEKCVHPVYNCVGNHDCYSGTGPWVLTDKKIPHDLLFNHTEDWAVQFMDCPHSMSYYKDFPEANLRMIVLDDYYHIDETREWLRGILEDARQKELAVFTAQHESMTHITHPVSRAFNTQDDFVAVWNYHERRRTEYSYDQYDRVLFEDILVEFIRKGGHFVCNFSGHDHVDSFGYTEAGILNAVVESGTTWDSISDIRRFEGTKSMDCFNVVSIDTNLGLLKLIRVGANVDHYMRKKTAICFDYIHQKLISEI